MLTLQMLKDMPSGTIFATGVTTDPRLYREEVKWLAKRGEGFHDWAIYYHLSNMSLDAIEREGDKCFTKEVIKELVPCDDEAFKLYRK